MSLTAKKAMRYNGRSLRVGDTFTAATARDARTLKAIGKAMDTPVAPVAAAEDTAALRAEAMSLGIHVDGRWGSARLSEAIASERQRRAIEAERYGVYQRRDMRAED